MNNIPNHWQWFPEARLGMFIHWGPYSHYGRGEQVLLRERLDQAEYERAACRWNPQSFDAAEWAAVAKNGGFCYAVLTTRHHDGYCLWDSSLTDYSSASQAPKRDFVREYVDAFRAADLRIGLYYSFMDARIPAFWDGPEIDPEGFESFRAYCHDQVRELLTDYGKIDVFWFDGAWPHSANRWRSKELVDMMRSLQPHILINNRLGQAYGPEPENPEMIENAGQDVQLGDFGTPEHRILAEERLWESCQVTTWRLWGWTEGERWRPPVQWLDMLCESASKGGNLLLNVGPRPDGRLPEEFVEGSREIGDWMRLHGEAIHSSEGGNVIEFVTHGWQTVKGNALYLIIRFWHPGGKIVLPGLATRVNRAILLTTGQELPFVQQGGYLTLTSLPEAPPTQLFPVIKLECDDVPRPDEWAEKRLWGYDPRINTAWAASRGKSVRVGT